MINIKNIKREKIPKYRLFNMLMKSKMIYGEMIKKTKSETFPYLYGIRHNYAIININYTVSLIVRLFKFLREVKKFNKKILIIGNSIDIKFMVKNDFLRDKKNKSILFLTESWKHGLITNLSVKNKHRNKKVYKSLKNNNINLIIILKSALYEPILVNELKNVKVPIVAITTTNSQLKNIQFPLLASSNNIKALYTLLYVIRNLV